LNNIEQCFFPQIRLFQNRNQSDCCTKGSVKFIIVIASKLTKEFLRSNLLLYLIIEKKITSIRQAHDKLMKPARENS
jgi:hypothetical protein